MRRRVKEGKRKKQCRKKIGMGSGLWVVDGRKKKQEDLIIFFNFALFGNLGLGTRRHAGGAAQDGRKIVAQGGTVSGRAVDW